VVNNNTVLQVRSLSLTSVPTPGVKHKSFRIFAAAAAATALSVLILSYMGGGGGFRSYEICFIESKCSKLGGRC
jgi:hypothetical protein